MKKNLLLFASAFALLLSCGKEAPEVATSPMPDVFYAKVDAATKAGFNYDDVNAKYVHFWNEGDQIYVFHGSARRTYSCNPTCTTYSCSTCNTSRARSCAANSPPRR